MAVTVWITELNEMANMLGGEKVQTPKLHPVAKQRLVLSGVTTAVAMNATTRCIRIVAKGGDAHILIGGAATTNDTPLIANVIEYFGVDPGDVISLVEGV